MKIIWQMTGIICVVGLVYYIWLDSRNEKLLKEQYEASLVWKNQLSSICSKRGVWIPTAGEKVKIKIDGSIGMVVFIAKDFYDAPELPNMFDRLDPNDCTIFGVDVRTTNIAPDEQYDGVKSEIVAPYAIIRFSLFELEKI